MSSVIAREGAFSIEFSVGSHRRTLRIGFWEGKRFVCMPMLHCGRDVPPTKSYFDLVSRLLSAISGDATIIGYGGSNTDFVKVLDKSPGRKTGVQYPFALAAVQFERLLHKPSFSVMRRIDMCSMWRALLLRLNGLLDERWVQSTQYFRMVRIGIISCGCLSSTTAERYFCVLQALEDGKLELSTAIVVVQEMIAHWPQIVTYISNTSQRQEFQHVEGRVVIFCV